MSIAWETPADGAMTITRRNLRVELTSVPDRDTLVAEVWYGDELLAELRHEPDGVKAQLYEPPAGRWGFGACSNVASVR